MSSFIVDYKDVDNVLNVVDEYIRNNVYFPSDFERCFNVVLPRYQYADILEELGRNILKLNIDAYNGRYKDDEVYRYADEYKFNDNLKVSFMQGLKSLQCIIYQCSEDGANTQELYKQLNKLKNILMTLYINDNEEYKQAKWGDCYEFASR